MKMIVAVRVHVIEREPGRPKGLELRPDLRAHLAPNRGPRRDGEPERREIAPQPAGRRAGLHDEVGNGFGRQNRPVVDQGEMQPDP